jgi:hypothetical protein
MRLNFITGSVSRRLLFGPIRIRQRPIAGSVCETQYNTKTPGIDLRIGLINFPVVSVTSNKYEKAGPFRFLKDD